MWSGVPSEGWDPVLSCPILPYPLPCLMARQSVIIHNLMLAQVGIANYGGENWCLIIWKKLLFCYLKLSLNEGIF